MANPDFFSEFSKTQEGPFGVANQFIGDIEKRKAYKLELAMKSQLMEQEWQQKQREMELQNQYKTEQFNTEQSMTPDFLNQFNKDTGSKASNLREVQASNASRKITASMTPKRQRTRVIKLAEGNKEYLAKIDDQGNVIGREEYRLRPEFAMQASKVESEFSTAEYITGKIRGAVEKFNTEPSLLTAYPQGLNTKLGVMLQYGDPQALAITKQSKAFALWLTAAVSGKQMTEKEQTAMLEMIPKPTDTIGQAMENIGTLEEMIQSKKHGAFMAFTDSNEPDRNTGKGTGERITQKGMGHVLDRARQIAAERAGKGQQNGTK